MATPIRKILIPVCGAESSVIVVDGSLASPPQNHVQVQVLYSGFSGADINMRMGTYPLQKKAPLTPGYCLVGRVHINGPGSKRFKQGDMVCALTVYDSEATYTNVAEKHLHAVPQGLDPKAVTALVLDYNTAYGMVHRAAKVTKGDRVFIHGLTGAVGNALLQLCQLQGAEIYGTASPRNHSAIRVAGATPFDYRSKTWISEMQNLGGVHAIFDPLGFDSWDESYSVLNNQRGVLVGYGGNKSALSGKSSGSTVDAVMPTLKLLSHNLNIFCNRKSTTFYYIDRTQKTFLPELQTLFGLLKQEKIKVNFKRVLNGLDEVPNAHREWTRMEGIGSVVVKIA